MNVLKSFDLFILKSIKLNEMIMSLSLDQPLNQRFIGKNLRFLSQVQRLYRAGFSFPVILESRVIKLIGLRRGLGLDIII